MPGKAKLPVRVIHRHRVGRYRFTRVSEITWRGTQPFAVLHWLYYGKEPVPGVCVPLDPAKLKRAPQRRVFRYDGETSDPRMPPARR